MSKQIEKNDQNNLLCWLFEPVEGEASKRKIWMWWEARRLIYNGLVILSGLISFAAYCFFLIGSGHLSPGEDIIEPIALIAAATVGPVVWNCAYCLGPIVDIAAFSATGNILGPVLLKLGMAFSVLLMSFPAIYWVVKFFQAVGGGIIGR
ncbi:MAG: hypothetical protein C0507_17300 [Cyanobacteria bacterium PR.3.49]|nr:hypothetical protein [Cyanobacteria bacterium PR.3.49]